MLVANFDGVHIVRDGTVVAKPVTSPAQAAFADGEGGIILTVAPHSSYQDIEASPLDRIWRVAPDGRIEVMFDASELAGGAGSSPTLYQVTTLDHFPAGPTLVFTVEQPFTSESPFTQAQVWALPLDAPAVLPGPIPIPNPGDGDVTGLGWLETENVYVMATASDGGTALSMWTADGDPVEWASNPETEETRCSADEGYNDCMRAATVIPDTSLIGYAVSDYSGSLIHNSGRATDLVIFDVATGAEVDRVRILTGPGYSTTTWHLHATSTTVAVSWAWHEQNDGGEWQLIRAAAVYDLTTRSLTDLRIGGVASAVGQRIGGSD